MWTLKNYKIEDFEILPNNQQSGHLCTGCWFFENTNDCTLEEIQPFLNSLFAQLPETGGSCKNHIAKLKTTTNGKEEVTIHS